MAGNARGSVTGSLADPDLGAAFGLGHLITSHRAFQNSKRPLPRLTQGIRVSHDALCCGKAEVGAWALVATARRGEGKATGGISMGGNLHSSSDHRKAIGFTPGQNQPDLFRQEGPLCFGV